MDKHVVKMILEYTQLLSTAHRILDGQPEPTIRNGKTITTYVLPNPEMETNIYQATHINHPSAKWVRENINNYKWLHELLRALLREYFYRYGKRHTVETEGLLNLLKTPPVGIPEGSFTPPALAMPDEFKNPNNHALSYRKYYKYGKNHLAEWKHRKPPPWWGQV